MCSDSLPEDYIFVYTRQNALEDGVLIDVSSLAREAGFKIPVAITDTLHNLLEYFPKDSCQDYTGRLWDVLHMLRVQVRDSLESSTVKFKVYILTPQHTSKARLYELMAQVHGGDNHEAVMTIGFEEDF